jgi:DNA polymerase III subunit beta
MNICKGTLHEALSKLAHVVDARASIPILRTVRVQASGGTLTVTGTDLTTWMRASLPCHGADLDVCVAAKALLAAVKPAGKGDKLTIVEVAASGDKIVVSSDGSRVEVETMPACVYPVYPGFGEWRAGASWAADTMKDALGWVLLASSNDETRPHLRSVYLDAVNAVATDGHRLHLAPFKGLRSGPVLLRAESVSALLRVLPKSGVVTASRDGDRVRFTVGEYEMIAQTLEGPFPQYRQVIPDAKSAAFATVLDGKLLVSALDRMPRGKAGCPKMVNLRVNGEVHIEREVEGTVSAASVPVIGTTHSGKDFRIAFDARYLVDAFAGGATATARFIGDLDPLRVEVGDRLAVVMPARM